MRGEDLEKSMVWGVNCGFWSVSEYIQNYVLGAEQTDTDKL